MKKQTRIDSKEFENWEEEKTNAKSKLIHKMRHICGTVVISTASYFRISALNSKILYQRSLFWFRYEFSVDVRKIMCECVEFCFYCVFFWICFFGFAEFAIHFEMFIPCARYYYAYVGLGERENIFIEKLKEIESLYSLCRVPVCESSFLSWTN